MQGAWSCNGKDNANSCSIQLIANVHQSYMIERDCTPSASRNSSDEPPTSNTHEEKPRSLHVQKHHTYSLSSIIIKALVSFAPTSAEHQWMIGRRKIPVKETFTSTMDFLQYAICGCKGCEREIGTCDSVAPGIIL